MLRVLHGKGNKFRTVAMDEEGFAALESWEALRATYGAKSMDPLFCTAKLTKVDPCHFRHLLPRLARAAGIAKRVHPHGLRHTCAAELAAEGLPMNMIQAQLGHNSLATTSTYLAHIAPTQLVAIMQNRPDWGDGETSV
jgi:site-specific recombinase XerD